VDMTVLDDGGNLVDACSLAAITALHGFRKPQTRITDGHLIVHRLHEQEPAPLSVHHIPVSVTLAFFCDPYVVFFVCVCVCVWSGRAFLVIAVCVSP
jgi:exosome complex RNA-binding protein Rrp42 (RNase PH superfamily)